MKIFSLLVVVCVSLFFAFGPQEASAQRRRTVSTFLQRISKSNNPHRNAILAAKAIVLASRYTLELQRVRLIGRIKYHPKRICEPASIALQFRRKKIGVPNAQAWQRITQRIFRNSATRRVFNGRVFDRVFFDDDPRRLHVIDVSAEFYRSYGRSFEYP